LFISIHCRWHSHHRSFSIASSTYKHFHIELHVIGLSIQPKKRIAWSPFSLSPNFNTPSQFTTPFKGIKFLGLVWHCNFHIILHQRNHARECSTYGPSLENGCCLDGHWNSNMLFRAMPIISFTMHTSIFHLHRVFYFLWFILP